MNAIYEIKPADAVLYVRGEDGWYAIGVTGEVFGERNCCGIELDGLKIGLFRVNGEIHALDDICTHGQALLSDGECDGYEIECPLHAGLVDVRTGRATEAPITRDTRHHETRVEGDVLHVRLQA